VYGPKIAFRRNARQQDDHVQYRVAADIGCTGRQEVL